MRMWGLRSIPLVGREAERDLLWSELEAVATDGKPRVVAVRGPSGTGKSRLVEWVCRRAHELGVARWARATCSPSFEPGSSLRNMSNDFLRTGQLERAEVHERIRAYFESHGHDNEHEIAVVTELLCPSDPNATPIGDHPVRLTRPYEYYSGIKAGMAPAAGERPIILWFDDVQWGAHCLGLARLIVRSREDAPLPCLILATVRDEALPDRPEEADGLRRLLDLPYARQIHLGPLALAHHRQLVRNLLGLAPGLAREVTERTAGNPMFAVQLVGSWVQRGMLAMSDDGLRLVDGADPHLPADVSAVWEQALDDVIAEFKPEALTYLEIAALLGQEVDGEEWNQACDDPQGHFGDRLPGDRALRQRLLEQLIARRLALGSTSQWWFVHGMLREALIRRADHAQRSASHHAACATMLWARAPSRMQSPAERLGKHLLHAGLVEMAVEPLMGGAERRRLTDGPAAALALLETCEQAMAGASLPERDKRWGKVWTNQARSLLDLGRVGEGVALCERALAKGTEYAWGGVERHALHTLADAALLDADLDRAQVTFETLRERSSTAPRHRGHALAGLARVRHQRGEIAVALQLLDESEAAFEQARRPTDIAEVMSYRARCLVDTGEIELATLSLQEALARFSRHGLSAGVASAEHRLGGLAERTGDLDGAATHLRTALERYERLGSSKARRCRLELASLLVELGQESEIPRLLEPLRARSSTLPHATRVGIVLGLELVDAAIRADWLAFDRALAAVGSPDDTASELVALGAGIAARHGATQRAQRARLATD
jgi:tetratricopeptide (TPR) repeat protein